MNKSKTLQLVAVLTILTILVLSFQAIAADDNFFTETKTFQQGLTTNVKAAYLNGSRYVFTGTGWGGLGVSPIKVYTADNQWQEQTLLTTSNFSNVQDFYVTTFPDVYPNYIIIAGVRNSINQSLFVTAFDTTMNRFVNMGTSSKDGYCTEYTMYQTLTNS